MNRFTLALSFLLFPWTGRQRKLAASRPALSKAEFITQIGERDLDPDAASLIWSHLEAWGLEKNFTPHPDDNLASVFGIIEEELEIDLLTNILARLDLPLPTTEMLREFEPVDTPLQVAKLASRLRQG